MRVREWFIAILALTLLAGGGCKKKRGPRTEHDWWDAAYWGNVQKAMDLIAHGVPPRLEYHGGQTPLHIAAERGHVELVRLLVGYGVPVDVPDKQGRRPIKLALDQDHRAVVECLVNAGAEVTLQVAAYLGDLAKIKELIESGRADARGDAGDSAMSYAISQGRREVVELLIDKGAEVDPPESRVWDRPLGKAVRHASLDMVKLLLARGADPNAWSSTHFSWDSPLGTAVTMGNVEIAEALIACGADVKSADMDGWSPLHGAIMNPEPWTESVELNPRMLKLLVDQGADVNAKDEEGLTPLHCAAYQGDESVVAYLLAQGADVKARTVPDPHPPHYIFPYRPGFSGTPGMTPLHEGVLGGEPNVIGLLIAHGAEANASDEAGNTTLHYAAASAGPKVVEALVGAGADVNARNKDGTAPLTIALRKGNVETAKALIAAGAEKVVMKNRSPRIRAEYEFKHEPLLHLAIEGRSGMLLRQDPSDAEPNLAEFRREWIELLLANGADPDEQDDKGDTPLLAALVRADEASARRLIAHGCDVNVRNHAGTTALHLVAADGRGELISLLLAKGADVNARDNDGDTPLHSAALRGCKEAVELLLSRKADPNLANNRGRTPLDEARRRGHDEVVQSFKARP